MELRKIRLRIGAVELEAELNRSETASLILDALPIRAAAQRWGDEIYFEIPVRAETEPDAREVMEVGELAYWPPGRALCIFWGPYARFLGGRATGRKPGQSCRTCHRQREPSHGIGSGGEVVIERA
ncbi:MAG TPA: cyclophilin-like fold protein [Vicinamibacteria bacterium]|nr:cyclophilin-like fold protein [Vicinamibacteria bacterium]